MQDFRRKMVVVVRNDLPSWQVLNTVGHISAYLGIGCFGEKTIIDPLTKGFRLWS